MAPAAGSRAGGRRAVDRAGRRSYDIRPMIFGALERNCLDAQVFLTPWMEAR